jgi:hypothetical protein
VHACGLAVELLIVRTTEPGIDYRIALRTRSILARRCAASTTENIHINLAGQAGEQSVARWPRLGRLRPRGAGRHAPRDALGTNGRRADARPRELRGRACRRPWGPPEGAVDAILECEALALSGPVPACVVRPDYLYGPESGDLRGYRTCGAQMIDQGSAGVSE